MSNRALLVGCVLLAGLPGTASAQDLRALAARLDTAHTKAMTTRAAIDTYRRRGVTRGTRWTDSAVIMGGKVKVLFNEAAAPYARDGITEAETQLQRLGDFHSRLPSLEFSVGPDSTRRTESGWTSVRFHPTPNTAITTSTEDDPSSIAEQIVGKVTDVAVSLSSAGLMQWRKGSLPMDSRAWNRTDWGTLRLDVVSSHSFLGRRCHGGDLAACRTFLGIDSVRDQVTDYYDPAGRQALVVQQRDRATRMNPAALRRCQAGDDAGCITLLRLMHDADRVPASEYARRTVLARALTVGGERAPERLLTSAGSAGEALSAAAGVPLDTLIMGWQRDMRERAAATSNLSLPIVASSILSIGICLALALRSSRWR